MALVDVDEVFVDPAVSLRPVGVECLPVAAAPNVLHLPDATPLDTGSPVTEFGRQPGLPHVGWFDHVVIDADDFRQRGGAAHPRCGVSHDLSSFSANGS